MVALRAKSLWACIACLFALAAGTYWLVKGGRHDEAHTAIAAPSSTSIGRHRNAAHDGTQLPARSVDTLGNARVVAPAPVRQSSKLRTVDDSSASSGASVAAPEDGALDYATDYVKLPPDEARWRHGEASETTLKGENLRGDLRFADLSGADLRGANVEDAILDFVDLRDSDLQDAVFSSTQLFDADLRGANLRGATMVPPVHFSRADLRRVDLRDVEFPTRYPKPDSVAISNFDEARLDGADLRGVDFTRALIFGAVFDEADLRGANLADTMSLPKSMRGAVYDRHTRFPDRIDPNEWQMIYVREEGQRE